MGDMPEVWFHDFLSLNTPRKQVARIFYHLMGEYISTYLSFLLLTPLDQHWKADVVTFIPCNK